MSVRHVAIFIGLLFGVLAQEDLKKAFTAQQIKCFAEDKVLFEGQCKKLLTKASCEDDEWLVLNKAKITSENINEQISPICQRTTCGPGEVYWMKARRCVNVFKEKTELCGDDKKVELKSNVFGEGECTCLRDPPHARVGGEEIGPCYQLYTQGPCKDGTIFAFAGQQTRKAECVPDPCHKELAQLKAKNKTPSNGLVKFDGKCYELNTVGPCKSPATLKVANKVLSPKCLSLSMAIFVWDNKDCVVDSNNECQQSVEIDKDAEANAFLEDMLAVADAKRKKKRHTNKRNKSKGSA